MRQINLLYKHFLMYLKCAKQIFKEPTDTVKEHIAKIVFVLFKESLEVFKGTVQRKLRGVLSGINRKLMIWA
jgi:predicted KAP-like P-loop ATPase